MSLNPFIVEYEKPLNLQMLASVATSLFAGRAAQAIYNGRGEKVVPRIKTLMPVSRTRTMTKTKKTSSRRGNSKLATVSAVKKMLNAVVETKQIALIPTVPTMALGTLYTFNLTAQILQGTTDGARVGDKISLDSVALRGLFATNKEAAFYGYRLLVFWSGEEFNPSTTSFLSTGFAFGDIFVLPGTGTQTHAIVNTKAITVVHDSMYDVNSQVDEAVSAHSFAHYINLKGQTFLYQAPGSVYGKTKNLYAVVIGKFLGGTVAPTDAGFGQINWKVQYKDA